MTILIEDMTGAVFFCRLSDGPPLVGSIVAAAAIAAAAVVLLPTAVVARGRAVAGIAGFGAVFQVGHFSEHGLQVGGLVGTHGLTLTWWASQIASAFAWLLWRPPSVGVEAMHFFGDAIYTAGILAWWNLDRGKWAARGAMIQGAHQLEHASLFATAYFFGTPEGLTTLGGGGPVWLRIILHFTLNLGGTVCWAVSISNAGVDRWAC